MRSVFRTVAAIAATTALCSTAALAQPSFTGFGVGINASYINHSTSESFLPSNLANDSSEAALTASYGFAMGTDWVGTVGLSLGLMDSNFGTYTVSYGSASAKTRQHIALSFAPGLRIGNDGLLYGKLAFHQMDVNYNNSFGFDVTKTHQGSGLGIGYAHALSPSLEVSVEYEAMKFEAQRVTDVDTAYPKQNNLNLGLTYRF